MRLYVPNFYDDLLVHHHYQHALDYRTTVSTQFYFLHIIILTVKGI